MNPNNRDERKEPKEIGPKTWGKLARRGAVRIEDDERGGASGAWRTAMDEARPRRDDQALDRSGAAVGAAAVAGPPDVRARAPERAQPKKPARGPSIQPDEWERVDDLDVEAERAVGRGRAASSRSAGATGAAGSGGSRANRGVAPTADDDLEGTVRDELARAVGPAKVERYEQRLKDASRAFEAERFTEAARMLKKLADEAPTAPAVRELYGLTLYRMGRWRPAAKELEAFGILSSSTEQHPVLADCYRALGQHAKVLPLWDELRAASPNAELVTEGRIVTAGSLADRGEVRAAVTLLEQGFTFPKRPKDHHLRRAYALADCYERAGDVVRARELFGKIRVVDAWFADVKQRERALS